MSSTVLVIFESGERTGHITADGTIGYTGDNEYIERVLEHFEGGRVYIQPAEQSDDVFRTGSVAKRSHGDDLLEAVKARVDPIPSVETKLQQNHDTE